MSPDFDRDRPSHEISRPISSRHLGRLLTKYGFVKSNESLPNIRPSSSVRPSLTAIRPGTSYSVPTGRTTSKESLVSRSQSAATTMELVETDFEFSQPIYSYGYHSTLVTMFELLILEINYSPHILKKVDQQQVFTMGLTCCVVHAMYP